MGERFSIFDLRVPSRRAAACVAIALAATVAVPGAARAADQPAWQGTFGDGLILPVLVGADAPGASAFSPIEIIEAVVSDGLLAPAVPDDWSSCRCPRYTGVTPADAAAASEPPAGNLVELPPPPDARVMVLTSLLAMGAWRALRQARDLHWAPLPEWYHSSAPDQVGHATLLDPAGSRSLVPACWYEALAAEASRLPSVACLRWRERVPRWQCSYVIPTAAPRSPPART